jgi:hypothetical protein
MNGEKTLFALGRNHTESYLPAHNEVDILASIAARKIVALRDLKSLRHQL